MKNKKYLCVATVFGFFVVFIIAWVSLGGYKDMSDSSDSAYGSTDEVTGFEISKIRFDALLGEDYKVTSDGDVIECLNQAVNKWKYTYDSLEFTFYFSSEISFDEEWFSDMNYEEIWQLDYPTRISVEVKYENINTEALKGLSQRNEISSIRIGTPSRLSDSTD